MKKNLIFCFYFISLVYSQAQDCSVAPTGVWKFNPVNGSTFVPNNTVLVTACIDANQGSFIGTMTCSGCTSGSATCSTAGQIVTCSGTFGTPASGSITFTGTASKGGTNLIGTATYDALLPIELTSFVGNSLGENIILNWQTASELNNEKFLIEYSTNGRDFTNIGEVKGAGTTQELQSYQFVHNTPEKGRNYYRLKQIDFDGRFEYSPTEAVVFGKKGKIAVFPTTTNGVLNIQTDGEGSPNVQVFDLNGSLMLQQVFSFSENMEINLSHLHNGIYIVSVQMDGQTYRERVCKF